MPNPQLGGPGYGPYSSLLPLIGPVREKTHGSVMVPELLIHVGLRIMQAGPPQQGDKLWVLRLKRQSILGKSYYLPPQNTTNKVLKALKTERLWLEKKSLWIHFSQSHLLGISYRTDKEFWFLPKIAGYFVTSLAATVLLSTRSPGIQSLAASLVPSRTGIHTKGVRLTVYNIVYDRNEHHKTRTTVYSYKCKEDHYEVKETDATTLYMQLEKETRIKKFTGLPRFKPWHVWYPCPRGDNPDFTWQVWSNGGKSQNPKKSLALNLTAKKSHAKFLGHKNFQKALNDITWKIGTLAMEYLCLFCNALKI